MGALVGTFVSFKLDLVICEEIPGYFIPGNFINFVSMSILYKYYTQFIH